MTADPRCKFCLEGGCASNPLISAGCLCAGSLAPLHRRCLVTWVRARTKRGDTEQWQTGRADGRVAATLAVVAAIGVYTSTFLVVHAQTSARDRESAHGARALRVWPQALGDLAGAAGSAADCVAETIMKAVMFVASLVIITLCVAISAIAFWPLLGVLIAATTLWAAYRRVRGKLGLLVCPDCKARYSASVVLRSYLAQRNSFPRGVA